MTSASGSRDGLFARFTTLPWALAVASVLSLSGGVLLWLGSSDETSAPPTAPTSTLVPETVASPSTTTTTSTEDLPPAGLALTEHTTIVATARGDGVQVFNTAVGALADPPDHDPTAPAPDAASASTVLDGSAPVADWWLPSPTQFDGPRVLRVHPTTDLDADWLAIDVPVRPNGTVGWIPRNQVDLHTVELRAHVDISDRLLEVWDGDDLLMSAQTAVGKDDAPTPTGTFFVRDLIERPDNTSYGPHIVALSGFSEVLESFNGAEPAIAIHGTNQPHLLGEAASNGCVRIHNDDVTALAELAQLGMTVSIVE